MHIDHGRQHLLAALASNPPPSVSQADAESLLASIVAVCHQGPWFAISKTHPLIQQAHALLNDLETDDCPECDGTGEGQFETACRGCRGSGVAHG